MPKLWNETIDAHRAAVRAAVMDVTATLVAEQGLTSVTMSQIAKESGIGRATLYKYFPDVEAILLAWHERQIGEHLGQLAEVRDRAADPGERLAAVLEAFALISHESRGHRDTELAAFLHRDRHVNEAEQQLHGMIRDLVTEGVRTGGLRDDIAPDELTTYCLHALTAAGSLPSKAAVRRLVTVTLAGMRPAAISPKTTAPGTGLGRPSGTVDSSPEPPHGPHRHVHGGHSGPPHPSHHIHDEAD